jgi:hypothetical protein
MLLCIASALAADVLLYAPEGPPAPGAEAPVEVLVLEAGAPVARPVTVTTTSGDALPTLPEVEPGKARFLYRAPADARAAELAVRVGGEPPVIRGFPLAAPPTPGFRAPPDVEAVVGEERIEVRFPRAKPPVGGPDALLARTSEGRVLEVRAEPDAVVVVVEPGPERVARVLAVALLDRDDPQARPGFALVRLRARPQLSITAEPGSVVNVRVGKRSFGPYIADTTGLAAVVFEVGPGESAYEITVADDLGNTQRSQGPLPTSTRPVLVGVEAPSVDGGAQVWLGAFTPTGTPWVGAGPLCGTGAAGRSEAEGSGWGRGVYRASVAGAAGGPMLFDPRVDCGLGEASVSLRVPAGAEQPERIELRVYPEALSADFPIAQVQAALLDRRGERLDPERLALTAARGALELARVDGALRGEYRGGQDAVTAGGDVLTAAWTHPAVQGVAWSLELHAGSEGAGARALVRARDRSDRPIGGVPVQLRLGDQTVASVTDARGWATARWEVAPSVATPLRVEALAGVVRETYWIPGEAAVLPDPAAPDLTASLELPVQAGRIRQVYLDVSPRPLFTGGGATATVTVRMLDAAGTPVRGESVTLEATQGQVAEVAAQPDGSIRATYTPPGGTSDQVVQIRATTSAGTVATDLQLTPRPVDGDVGLSVGWISNFNLISAPTLSLFAFRRIPGVPRWIGARLGVTTYTFDTTVADAFAEEEIRIRGTLVPFDLGVQVQERWGRRSLHAGIAAVVAPYALTADFGDERGLSGVAMARPGLAVQAGGGYRLGNSEIFAEARFLVFSAGTSQVSFDGSLGGLSLTGGYRLLY